MIPARGGSKGVPGKNIKLFLGKPLIAHAIRSAIKSKDFQSVIVTTDDKLRFCGNAESDILRFKRLEGNW